MTVYNSKEIVLQSLPVLLFSAIFSVYAGVILEGNTAQLSTIPLLIFLLPSFVDSCGDVASLVAARITSALYLGKMHPTFDDPLLIKNATAGIILGLMTAVVIAISAHYIGPFFNVRSPGLLITFEIVILSAMLTQGAMILMAIPIAFITFRRNLDPSNFASPILSTFGDLIGIYILILISKLLGG